MDETLKQTLRLEFVEVLSKHGLMDTEAELTVADISFNSRVANTPTKLMEHIRFHGRFTTSKPHSDSIPGEGEPGDDEPIDDSDEEIVPFDPENPFPEDPTDPNEEPVEEPEEPVEEPEEPVEEPEEPVEEPEEPIEEPEEPFPQIAVMVPVSSIDTLQSGDTFQFAVKIEPETEPQSVEWFSHNAAASVDETGLVKGLVGDATAIIEVTSKSDPTVNHLFQLTITPRPFTPLVIPVMTSNTTPAPYVASASSTLADTVQAFNAFDDNDLSSTIWTPYSGYNHWIQIDTGDIKAINAYSIACPQNNGNNLNSWNVSGSLDGINWTVLHTVTGVRITDWTYLRHYTLDNTQEFRYYRLQVEAINSTASSARPTIRDLDFYHT